MVCGTLFNDDGSDGMNSERGGIENDSWVSSSQGFVVNVHGSPLLLNPINCKGSSEFTDGGVDEPLLLPSVSISSRLMYGVSPASSHAPESAKV